MKTKMEYTTVEKIDEQMQRLEMKLQHTSVSIQEEKKILDDIKKLRASRVMPPGLALHLGNQCASMAACTRAQHLLSISFSPYNTGSSRGNGQQMMSGQANDVA